MAKILIVKLGAIGDVVMAIPAAHAMYCAGFEVDWVCGISVLPLLERYGWIRPIVLDDRVLLRGSVWERLRALTGVWRSVSGERYELCATLYYDARYRLVSLPVRARRRVMLSHEDRLRRLLPGRHHTDEYARVMQGRDEGPVTVGLAPVRPDSLPVCTLLRLEGRPRVVLVPGGARNSMRDDGLRRWPLESYAVVAEELLARGMEVVLVGGPDDQWASAAFGTMAVRDEIGKRTILETVALLETAQVVVTHDTGPLHLAGITSAGIVGVFGPTDPRGRLPQRAGVTGLWGGEGFACRPCYDGRDYAPCAENACIRQVTPSMVVGEVERLLAERRQGRQTGPRVMTPESTVGTGWLR